MPRVDGDDAAEARADRGADLDSQVRVPVQPDGLPPIRREEVNGPDAVGDDPRVDARLARHERLRADPDVLVLDDADRDVHHHRERGLTAPHQLRPRRAAERRALREALYDDPETER